MRRVIKYCQPKLRARLLAGDEPNWLASHIRASYIRSCVLSHPDWVDRQDLRLLSAWADAMTAFTGVYHVLDHDVPVSHPYVCGLSVPWNFRVVPWAVNAAKGNKWAPDQLDLFEQNA